VATTPDAREQLILAAERLIAEGGANVSLRAVAAGAGQRNNSAIAYHFGSRDGLIEAIVTHRLDRMEAERMELLAGYEQAEPADRVRDLVTVLVRPMFRSPYRHGSTHYARFLEKVRDHPAVVQAPLLSERSPATRIVTARLDRALGGLPVSVRRQRLTAAATVMFALIADAERRDQLGSPAIEEGVVDMLVGLLTAPCGP